ncbi:carbon-phosphorus lyase complex subunit PhnI [Aestuariirhabdus sp. Z084]|uniref:carbon-phosphorus lyase complex subunit PhnI n=1 Tax=Aestuariirhabdus haliotis TaxID=2918751 RepID=UPI00201B3EA2|nr:carbon-phosphorus lyase complex subunit PhnI [Aestuariirhabdus haliotis]MCL6416005.1 carbon-phosphorus lyase complex subunit PhnI [Aestuariirhabdus haliotis]MCL6419962.1 carbon-phosphorus lyase complex subunit PhnI [Aestuariirhabdus haliotis]
MYVAVKGGEQAIESAHKLLAKRRRGDLEHPELDVKQIEQQLSLSVDRVMTEGSVYDPELAALAIKQAAGDLVEAIFLLRAYRTTLTRFGASEAIDTGSMKLERRISATYKDVPGGQILGSTFDYTHRLLDFSLMAEGEFSEEAYLSDHAHLSGNAHSSSRAHSSQPDSSAENDCSSSVAGASIDSRVMGFLEREGLMIPETDRGETPADITQDPPTYPADRSARLQGLVRGDEGFLLALGYSTQRGYGRNHPFAGEIRTGAVEVSIVPEELGFEVVIGEIQLTECEMVNGFTRHEDDNVAFTRGYGLGFGRCERKAMAMALVDRALQAADYEEEIVSPAQQEEFVLSHCDNVEAAGFVSHLKLPHYVDFQSELELLRRIRSAQPPASSKETEA